MDSVAYMTIYLLQMAYCSHMLFAATENKTDFFFLFFCYLALLQMLPVMQDDRKLVILFEIFLCPYECMTCAIGSIQILGSVLNKF